ncbi:hypothetical protein FG170_03845 [Serratia marcescens]|nr:hypothetical protein FG170_03845 [Serratia marcescens]
MKTNHQFFRLPTCPDVDEEQPLTSAQVYKALGYDVNLKWKHGYKAKIESLLLNDKKKHSWVKSTPIH